MDDFSALTPDLILDAIESLGYATDARIIELNSYENRVFQVGIEASAPIITKFYRPNRWTDAMIREEHQLTYDFYEEDLSVVPPLTFEGRTLFNFDRYRFSIFERRGGRAPEVDNLDCLTTLGRHIALMHNIGARNAFTFRPELSVEEFGRQARATLIDADFVPTTLLPAYDAVSSEVLRLTEQVFAEVSYPPIRVHGDCHMGNVLWREDTPHFVDFDDARMGPSIQDLWMLLSGDRAAQTEQLQAIRLGYQDFRDFPTQELRLVEALRALRLMHQAAWIARRWQEAAFQRAFPFFEDERYWSNHILALREQCGALIEPPLSLF